MFLFEKKEKKEKNDEWSFKKKRGEKKNKMFIQLIFL